MDQARIEQVVDQLDHYVQSFDHEQIADIVRIVLAVSHAETSARRHDDAHATAPAVAPARGW